MESGDYIALLLGSTREKQRFMRIAAAVLQQVTELQAVVGEINGAFAPESAQGAQLETLAESLGLSRLDTSVSATVTDVDFQKNFTFSGAGLFFVFGEYSDVDEADFRNAFYLLRKDDVKTVRS